MARHILYVELEVEPRFRTDEGPARQREMLLAFRLAALQGAR